MKTCALLFSGGLDSVAMAILLKREGLDVIPVYMSHRHGGNVVKKELVTASQLAREITGRDLLIVKKRSASRSGEAWYHDLGHVFYSRRLPISKIGKNRRNRTFLGILKDLGLDQCNKIALGVFGPSTSASVPDGDVVFANVAKSAPWLKRGQLVTFESMGIPNKVAMLKAVGRGKKNREWLWFSESCLMYFNTACGECASCHDRVDAFMTAWGQDKTRYRKGTYAARRKRRKS